MPIYNSDHGRMVTREALSVLAEMSQNGSTHGKDPIVLPVADLRDYFAAQAMGAIVDLGLTPEQVAMTAYRVADAMLTARTKGQEQP